MSPYATMLQINNFLKEKLVREIQLTKTGFAIYLILLSAKEIIFDRMGEIESFLSTQGECKVKTPTSYSVYLISGIPNSFVGLNGTAIEMVDITVQAVSEALKDLTKVSPINVLEPRSSIKSQYSKTKDWIVLYPEGAPLSRNLPLFGVRVHAKLLPKRIKSPQCGKCFGWHNKRACARKCICTICGSCRHAESGHESYDPKREHPFPPKCANCHGPHPANSLECLIRPRKD